jgi:hypothetical protein
MDSVSKYICLRFLSKFTIYYYTDYEQNNIYKV